MTEPANLLPLIRMELAKYTFPMTDDQCVELCNAVAYKAGGGWGLSRKVGGTRGKRYDGQECAHDILHHLPSNLLFDILVDAPEHPKPAWQNQGVPQSPDRTWVAPILPKAELAPAPPPTPSSGPTLADVVAKLDVLNANIRLLAHNSTLTAEGVQRLEAALDAGIPLRLRAKVIGDIRGVVGGQS